MANFSGEPAESLLPGGGISTCTCDELEQYNCVNRGGLWDDTSCACNAHSPLVIDVRGNGGNADGAIDTRDNIFTRLRLWRDANHNGVSEPAELSSLPALSVVRLHLDFKASKRVEAEGNEFRYRARIAAAAARRPARRLAGGFACGQACIKRLACGQSCVKLYSHTCAFIQLSRRFARRRSLLTLSSA